MRVSRRGRDGMINAHSVDTSSPQEGCVENAAASVEMPTDTPSGFHANDDLRRITSFRFSHIADSSLCFIPGITNALKQMKENNDAKPNEELRNTDPTRPPRHNQQRNKVRPSR